LKSKKADLNIVTSKLVDLFYVIVIIIILLGVNMKISDTKIHDLRVSSRNVAFSHDAILASPGTLNYIMPLKEDIKVNIINNCVVESSIKDSYTPERYECAYSLRNLGFSYDKNKLRFNTDVV